MRLHLTALLVVCLFAAPAAEAAKGGFKGYEHAQYVCVNGKGKHQKRACKLLAKLVPQGEAQIKAHIFRTYPASEGRCLIAIIGPETAGTWSPTIWNYAGSGAYGLPQALPGHKMASAGSDWRWNPVTQLRWMWRYVNARYGGACRAYEYRKSRGTY